MEITWPIIITPYVLAVIINVLSQCLLNKGINYGDASGTVAGRWEEDRSSEDF